MEKNRLKQIHLQEQDNGKTEIVMVKVDDNHKIYTDQTGKYPITSIRGNKYILIIYVYDANAILAAPLKSRSGIHILEEYNKKLEHLNNGGYIPRVHWLDNEASDSPKKYNKK